MTFLSKPLRFLQKIGSNYKNRDFVINNTTISYAVLKGGERNDVRIVR